MLDSLRRDAVETCRPWLLAPRYRARLEATALSRVFVPHAENNDFRKLLLLVLVVVWVGLTFEIVPVADSVPAFTQPTLSGFLLVLIGRMWDIEVRRLSFGPSVEFGSDDEDE